MEELHNIRKAIKSIIKKAYVSRADLDDSSDYPRTQITYFGDKTSDAERVSPYGLYCNLPEDTSVLLFSANAHHENKAIIGYAQKNRFKNLKPGEVVVGNVEADTFVKFHENGDIEVQGNGKLNITTTGDININGGAEINITAPGEINIDAGDINLENGTINVTGDAEINADNVDVNATQVNLGSGGADIARAGDPVSVNLGTGIGTITSGGTNTSI